MPSLVLERQSGYKKGIFLVTFQKDFKRKEEFVCTCEFCLSAAYFLLCLLMKLTPLNLEIKKRPDIDLREMASFVLSCVWLGTLIKKLSEKTLKITNGREQTSMKKNIFLYSLKERKKDRN